MEPFLDIKHNFIKCITTKNDDERFMLEALREARVAFLRDEVPVGSVLVLEGSVIAGGHNQVELLKDATAHAEMLCLTAGSIAMKNWRLNGTTLYTTLEPCMMCAGAMHLARVENLVWATEDIRHGTNGSWIDIFDKKHPTHEINVRTGVLKEASAWLLKEFFKNKR